GSSTLTWTGSSSGDWNTSTANWLSGGSPAIYANGDFVRFFDGANNYSVNLSAALSPGGVIVSNTAPAYTFAGSGSIEGSGSLLKQGSGTLVIDNTGNNTFDGGIAIEGGALQIGNNDSAGNLPGPIVNNGSVVFARSDAFTSDNAISGTGSVVQSGAGGTLTLSGLNTFTGSVLVTNNSTLKVGSSSALGGGGGSVVIANGSTFDINGYYQSKPIIVSGAGVDGTGAITDSGGAVYGLTSSVTLTGDTTFNFPSRWDLSGATLSTENHPYNLTLNSAGYFEFKNLSMDSALANITVASGNLGLIGTTSLGDPSATLTLSPGAALTFYNDGGNNVSINKHVDFQNGASINTGGGNDVISGSMTLADGYCSFNIGGGTSLTLNNTLSGSGIIYQNTGNGTLILAGNSPAFSGGVALYNGELVLNGSIGSGITSVFDTRVSGTGTASGLVDISGALLPGRTGVAGTFHAAAGLVLEGGAVWTNDLSSTVGGNNDLLEITGDLTANGNTIYLNPIGGGLADGTYTLATYTGTLNGSFGAVQTTTTTSYTLVLTNVTTTSPKQLQVIVSGNSAPSLLVWNNAVGNAQWDVQSSANWSNVTAHLASDVFHFLDSVVFDDTINSSPNPATTITIPADQIVVPSAITNNSTVDYTITGSGRISGSGPLVKNGSGTLTLSSSGDFTGPVTIAGGTIKTAGGGTLNSVSSITITNSGTLDFAGNTLGGTKPVIVSGAGIGGAGAIVNNGNDFYSQTLNISLAGDATIGGAHRWDLTSGSAISGPHKLAVKLAGGYGEWDSVTLATNVGDIEIVQGGLGIKGMGATFGNSNSTITVDSGASLTFWNSSVGTNSGYAKNIHVQTNAVISVRVSPSTFFDANLILDGGAQWNYFSGGGSGQTMNGTYTLNGPVHLQIGDSTITFNNVISGPGGFVWDNYNNEVVFAAANTYTGPTVIGNGRKLVLSGGGSIADSSLIFFGGADSASVRLNVSGRSDQTLTLANGQTLAGIGAIDGNLNVATGATVAPAGTNVLLGITTGGNAVGTIRVTNSITLNGTMVIKLNGNGSNDKLQAVSIASGGTLNLVNISGNPLAAGDTFQIFNATSLSGSLPVLSPATPGTGLAWDTSALLSNGTLKVVATSAGPAIGHISISGGNVILSGTNSSGSGTFQVLTSTNLAKPLMDWDVLTSGTFDSNGAFSVTNPVGTGAQRFYILQIP
ncbi:MAG TPA: autotransporter-associated beta strand repeat-containing protein, partial [Verrucomicrobiae bacterium]|nr:autotransporter-associated beta strand repeat-containing protein [Verrucomicrobiae bacterium]